MHIPIVSNYMNQRKKEREAFQLVNRIFGGNRTGGSKKPNRKTVIELFEKTRLLSQQTHDKWRRAEQIALNTEKPRRFLLDGIYYDILKDLHLGGVVEQRRLKTINRSFSLVNSQNEADSEMTKLLRRPWFKQWMTYAWNAKLHGHSLIELGESWMHPTSGKLEFCNVKLVPRAHVVPEQGTYLKRLGDEKGTSYREGKVPFWVSEVGDGRLGLLNDITPAAISKKNMSQFWDQFGEMFGMPIRIAKTASRKKEDLDMIEGWLEELGSAAFGLFPEGTDIEIKDSTRGDAFEVYDRRIDRCNSEMSKKILTVTMTADNGSSKSQSSTHKEMLDEVIISDREDMAAVINDQLIPLLIYHGYPFQGLEWRWDDVSSLSLKEQLKIDQWLLGNFITDPKWLGTLSDRYNVPITAIKSQENEE